MDIVATVVPEDKPRRGGSENLRSFPKGTSGNPRGKAALRERAAALRAAIEPELEPLTVLDGLLLDRACLLLARSERVHRLRDIDPAIRMTSEARRILQSLRRRHAAPRDEPVLADVLRARYASAQPVDAPGNEEGIGGGWPRMLAPARLPRARKRHRREHRHRRARRLSGRAAPRHWRAARPDAPRRSGAGLLWRCERSRGCRCHRAPCHPAAQRTFRGKPVKPAITLTQAMADPDIFGNVFSSPSFWTWKVVAKVLDGQPLVEQREIELFQLCTGCSYNRHTRRAVRRLILLCGRRAGKDRFLSAVATWRAALCADWRQYASAGEGQVCILLGRDKRQSAILRKYCHGLLQAPLLAREIARSAGETTEFKNGASLEIATNDAHLVRGRSAIAVLGSECAHWQTDEFAASSDEEVVSAAEMSMGMCPDQGLLLLGSSVYRRRGYMYRQYRKLHGNDDADAVCWFAPSRVMNSKLPQSVIDAALAEDAPRARAEYENVWREDISDFIPLDVIESCTDWGVTERPPERGIHYVAGCDTAGGTGRDSFAMCVTHSEQRVSGKVIVDLIRERRPRFVFEDVVREYAEILRTYHVYTIYGDGHAAGISADSWQRNGITFQKWKQDTSDNYLASLPLLTSKRARLVDNATIRTQFTALERKVVGGHEEVTHPSSASAHDDVVAAVCMALSVASGQQSSSAWMAPANLRKVTEQARMRPPNPRFAQHRSWSERYGQHGNERFWEQQLGERRAQQLRRGIIPGRRLDDV
jgi:hypothetical protein